MNYSLKQRKYNSKVSKMYVFVHNKKDIEKVYKYIYEFFSQQGHQRPTYGTNFILQW